MENDPFDRDEGELPWRKAEIHGESWMQNLGFADATVTQSTRDNGVDVESADAYAQVKLHGKAVRRPDVQRIRGAAYTVKHAIIYSHSGYTADAIVEADRISVALFNVVHYDPVPVNLHAHALLDEHAERMAAAAAAEAEAERMAAAAAAEAEAERLAEAEVISDRYVTANRTRPTKSPKPPPQAEPSQAVREATARYEVLRAHAREAAAHAKRWEIDRSRQHGG